MRQVSKFDESTGQVYTEGTAPIQCSDDHNWTRRRQRQRQPISESAKADVTQDQKLPNDAATSTVCPQRGARTLRDSVIRYIVQNISSITLEAIESLPLHLIRQVWDAVKESDAVSFDTWRTFLKVLRHDAPDPTLFQFRCKISFPASPLHIYTMPLALNPFETLTSLSLTEAPPLPELVRLSDLRNLVSLEIMISRGRLFEKASEVSNRLVREWHLAALNDGAFQVLRVLRLWNFPEVTCESVEWLDAFPALVLYDIAGCGSEPLYVPMLMQMERKWSLGQGHICNCLDDACFMRNPYAQFWSSNNQGKMRFIPREQAEAFLSQTASSVPLKAKDVNQDLYPLDFDSWKDNTFKVVSMLGYLQNDADFGRAGYDISSQAVIGNELVNSIPIVSLHLGPQPDIKRYAQPMWGYNWFSRSRITRPYIKHPAEDRYHPVEGKDRESTSRQNAKRKQEKQGVVRTKKRLLNDLLGSFL